ncbi:hypothetical protein SAMN04488113_12715 [Alkalibacterium gilvum]|uniref:Uncharacterized protein n=1 Tax=Alkalibacterium gilvum TaxID=1130080 RepID=A0A1H6UFC5_9LACT|nr:hypothetical protein [Alkalibacterium gilvum]SEI86860.1 hypothetical protein SAMN04488113_12715 [Alkalibacterium gilvum]
MLLGRLIGTLGLEAQTANLIISVISTGGVYAAAAIWPVIAPFIVTIKGITAIAGITAISGF